MLVDGYAVSGSQDSGPVARNWELLELPSPSCIDLMMPHVGGRPDDERTLVLGRNKCAKMLCLHYLGRRVSCIHNLSYVRYQEPGANCFASIVHAWERLIIRPNFLSQMGADRLFLPPAACHCQIWDGRDQLRRPEVLFRTLYLHSFAELSPNSGFFGGWGGVITFEVPLAMLSSGVEAGLSWCTALMSLENAAQRTSRRRRGGRKNLVKRSSPCLPRWPCPARKASK